MPKSNIFLFIALILAVAACSPPLPDADGGPDSGTDAQPTDAPVIMDTRPGTDVPAAVDAQGDGPPATDANFGLCGESVFACICACTDQNCRQACVFNNSMCLACVQNAQRMCCPAEDTAYRNCGLAATMPSDAGPACTDQACVDARCMSQLNAYNGCLATQSTMTECRGHLATCLPGTCP